MVDQVAAAMNFQHGETYLSAASDTAVRYAVNKRVGSELISYTLDFLQELLRHRVPGIRDDLYKEYPLVFNLLNISAAPILVELTSVSTEDLAAQKMEAMRHRHWSAYARWLRILRAFRTITAEQFSFKARCTGCGTENVVD